MTHLSTLQAPESGDPARRLAVIGSVRKLADGRSITTTVTKAGGRGRVTTPAGGAR